MDWLCPSYNQVLYNQLSRYHGTLTPQLAIQVREKSAFASVWLMLLLSAAVLLCCAIQALVAPCLPHSAAILLLLFVAPQDVMSIVQTGDLHVYVADLPNDQLYFSVAAADGQSGMPSCPLPALSLARALAQRSRGHRCAGPLKAYDRPFIHIDLAPIWAVKPRSA